MADEEEVVTNEPEAMEFDIDGAKRTCTITSVKKKGQYYYAYATCGDGRKVSAYSSNINVAKTLACNKCG